jgi:hypothetical protein
MHRRAVSGAFIYYGWYFLCNAFSLPPLLASSLEERRQESVWEGHKRVDWDLKSYEVSSNLKHIRIDTHIIPYL